MITTLYEKFRHWSDGGSVWLLSDLHFEDKDTKLMCPSWISPKEQIEIINSRVNPNDTFICLGDVGNPEWVDLIRAKYKVLIMGNHDTKGRYRDVFNEIYTGPVFIADRVLLSHEPIESECWLNIHGHDHRGVERKNCLNLAANICGYTPINLGKLIKNGALAHIPSIHRITIDKAVENCAQEL